MDQFSSRLKQLTTELRDYIETRIDLLVLNLGEQVTLWLGQTIQKIIGFTILGVGLFFSMIALAVYLGEIFESIPLGFLAVSAPLILLGLLFSVSSPNSLAKGIQNQFMDGILKSLEKKNSSDNIHLEETQQKQLPSKGKETNE